MVELEPFQSGTSKWSDWVLRARFELIRQCRRMMVDFGDKYEMLVTDSRYWWRLPRYHRHQNHLKRNNSPRLLMSSMKLLWSMFGLVKNLSAFSFNWFRTFETKFLEHPDMTSSLECRLASNSQQIHHISNFYCPVQAGSSRTFTPK